MIKEYINIFKNYYELIKYDKRKLIPYYIGYFLEEVIELIIPIYIAKITEDLTNSLFITSLISIIMYFFLKNINTLISYFIKNIYTNFFKNNYVTLYKKIVKEIYNFDEKYKKKFSTGRMLNSLTNDIINVGEMADDILTVILNILKSIIVIIYFFKINICLLIFVILIDIIYIKRSNYLNNMTIKYLKKQVNENDKLIGLISQTLTGLKDIQTLGISNTINDKYNTIYRSWKNMYSSKRKYQVYKQTILKCLLILVKTSIYFLLAYLVINKEMTIGVMLIIISYFDSLFQSSENIMQSLENIKEQNVSVNRIKEILEYNTVKEYEIKSLKNIKGLINFNNVSFSYNDERFLENLEFTIKPNKITAIIGTNGTGKTTITNLILRLYSPTNGKILLDGNDINNIDKKTYLKEISILNQETYLFNLSIRQNFNLINKDINKQQEICKFVGIDKFIKKLPKGYDTIIEENSNNISGGQKRLISLARTLLKNSKILILDEATSSLDTNMTKNFISILKKLKKNHTVIVVTHKNAIIDIADEIITIDKGKSNVIK